MSRKGKGIIILSGVVIITLNIIVAWGFLILWDLSAYDNNIHRSLDVVEKENLTVFEKETKINIKNYYPNYHICYISISQEPLVRRTPGNDQTKVEPLEFSLSRSRREFDINISKVIVQYFYGKDTVGDIETYTNLTIMPYYIIPPFRSVKITVYWNYSINYSSSNQQYTYLLQAQKYFDDEVYNNRDTDIPPWSRLFEGSIEMTRSYWIQIILPVTLFLIAGFGYAWKKNWNDELKDLRDGLGYLVYLENKDVAKEKASSEKGDTNPYFYMGLDGALRSVCFKPELLGHYANIIFTPAIVFFRIIIRNKVQRILYSNKIKDNRIFQKPVNNKPSKRIKGRKYLVEGTSFNLEEKTASGVLQKKLTLKSKSIDNDENIRNQLEAYLKDPLSKPGKDLIKANTIVLIVGFLATVGISFSFSSAAIIPIIYAIGITYIVINLGFLVYLVCKSKRDRRKVMIYIGITWLIVWFTVFMNYINFP